MRLTTKIILGIILAINLLSLILIIGFSFSDMKDADLAGRNDIYISRENTNIELPSFKTIVIEGSDRYNFYFGSDCNIYFEPIKEEHNTDMISIPEELKDFISIQNSDDTLRVMLDIVAIGEKYRNRSKLDNIISGINIHFNTPKTDIINKISMLPLTVKNIEANNINISSSGDINIIDCKTHVVNPHLDLPNKKLFIKNSEVKKLNLDLDNISKWTLENCKIEEAYMTGSEVFRISHGNNDIGTINWAPKNKNAELNIKIQKEPKRIVIR